MTRWLVYQRERFPILAHAPLVAAFSGSAICLSSLLRGQIAMPSGRIWLGAFVTSLLFFLQLRIADEFKDCADDARFRPYRPVPRGLVTLGELGWVAAAAVVAQLGLAWWLAPALVPLLVLIWSYLALMTREFFAAAWLKARPLAYMSSHMVIVPLIDLYATACDWRVAGLPRPPAGLYWFITVSFFNGFVVEIGRKIRAPQDEEPGVQTYTVLWGQRKAVGAWLAALGVTAVCASLVAQRIGARAEVNIMLLGVLVVCLAVACRFARRPTSEGGKAIETMSGVWTLLMYLSVGAAPLALAVWRAGAQP